MKLTLIKSWLRACEKLKKAYRERKPITCPFCAIADKEAHKAKGHDTCICPWMVFTGETCWEAYYTNCSYERRIKRIEKWERNLEKML